jgi:hypothetical protein
VRRTSWLSAQCTARPMALALSRSLSLSLSLSLCVCACVCVCVVARARTRSGMTDSSAAADFLAARTLLPQCLAVGVGAGGRSEVWEAEVAEPAGFIWEAWEEWGEA